MDPYKNHLSLIYHHVSDLIFLVQVEGDSKYRCIEVNRSYLEATGIKKEQIIGKCVEEILPKPYSTFVLEKYNEAIQRRETIYYEETLETPKGILVVEVTLIPIFSEDGTCTHLLGTARDITQRRMDQKQLEDTHNRNELILNSVGEGICGVDRMGIITFVNQAAIAMTGFERDELIGQRTTLFKPAVYSKCPIEEALANGVVYHSIEEEFRRKDGSAFPVEYVSKPIFVDHQIVGAVISFKDISERKKTEELLLKTERHSLIGQLAAGVAHELRNPLTTVKGFLQLLKPQLSEYSYYFDIMLSELDRIDFISNEFLVLAKPQAVYYQDANLRTLLVDITKLLTPVAILNNVQIHLDADQGLYLYCVEKQIKQVFINILKNAIESMPTGGEVMVEARGHGPDHVVVRIVDQGCGIPEDRIPHLGKPFYSLKEKGTGLGLMVSYKIVENHQGSIHIESEVNKGTTFKVILPKARQQK